MADLDIRIRMDSSGAEAGTARLTQAVSAIGAQATRSQGVLANMMIGFNQGLEIARKAMQVMQGVFDSTVGSAIKFESALKEVTTLFDATAEDQSRLTQEVLKFQKQFGADAITTTKAYYQAISSGAVDASTAQELMISANKLAIGGVTDVETAVNGLTNAISGFGLTASDSTRISDLLFIGMKNGKTTVAELSGNIGLVSSTANALGISLEETVASMSALTTAGISTNVATTQLKALMTNLVKPTDDLSKAFKQAGIESIDLALKQDGLIGVLGKIKGTTDGSASSLQKLFGSVEAGSAVLSLTGEQAKTFNKNMLEMGEASKNVGATTEEAFNKMANSAEFQLNLLKANVSAVFTEIGLVILPVLTSALKILNEAFKYSAEIIDELKNVYSSYKEEIIALGAFIGTLAVGFAAYNLVINASAIAMGAYTIAMNIATVATTAFTTVMAILTSPITLVIAAIAALVAGIVYYTRNQDLCNGYIKQFGAYILKFATPAIDLLIDGFVEAQRGLDILGGGLQIAMGFFGKFASFIIDKVLFTFDAFLFSIEKIVGVFDKDMAKSIENARNTIKGFVKSIEESSDAMIANGKETIKNALISEEYGKKKDALKSKVRDLSKSLKEEGEAQVDLAKKQNETKEGLKEVAHETTKLQKETKNLTAEKNVQTNAISKNSNSLDENKKTKKENADATKALLEDEKQILSNFQSQSDAIDEMTKSQKEYIKELENIDAIAESANKKSINGQAEWAKKQIEDRKKQREKEIKEEEDALNLEEKIISDHFKSISESSKGIFSSVFGSLPTELNSVFSSVGSLFNGVGEHLSNSIKESLKNPDFGEFSNSFGLAMLESFDTVLSGFNILMSASIDVFKAGMSIAGGSIFNSVTNAVKSVLSLPKTLNDSMDGLTQTLESVNEKTAKETEGKLKNELEISKIKSEGISKELAFLQDKKNANEETLTTLSKEIKEKKELLEKENDGNSLRINNELELLSKKKDNIALEIKEKKADLKNEDANGKIRINSELEVLTKKQDNLALEIKEKKALLKNENDSNSLRINNELELLTKKQEKEKETAELLSKEIKTREDLNKTNEDSTKKTAEELTKVSETIANSFSSQIKKLSGSTSDFIKSITQNAPEIIDSIVKELPSLFDALTKSLPALMDAVTNAIPKIVPALVNGFTKAFLAIIPKIPALISAIVKQIPKLIEGIMKIVPAIILAIPEIVTSLLNEIPNIIKTIVENMPAIIEALVIAIPQVIQAIIIALPDIIAAIVEYSPDIIMAIIMELPYLFTALVELIPSLLEQLAMKLPEKLGEALLTAGSKIWEGLKIAFQEGWDAIKELGSKIWTGFWDSVKKAWAWFSDLGHNIWVGLYNGIVGVWAWFANIGNNIWVGLYNGIVGVWAWFKNIGKQIWNGLAEGLNTVGDFFTTGTEGGAVWYNPISWFANGGVVKGYSDGGLVGGNGIDSTSYDTIPAMLSPGEIVIPKSAISGGIPSIMEFLNNVMGGNKLGFAYGGIVEKNYSQSNLTTSLNNENSIMDEVKNNEIWIQVLKVNQRIERILSKFDYEGLPETR